MADRPRVLLSNVIGPYDGKYNKPQDAEWLDYFNSRLTKEPGPFALSTYPTGTSLQLIAANLKADVTVLVHPTMEDLKRELEKGWDVVGYNFLIKGVGKVFPMVAAARKYAPDAKVVIGGFGTMLHDMEAIGADEICTGEGVTFMRRQIGQPEDDPVVQPIVENDVTLKIFRNQSEMPRFRMGLLTHGFGCPHKCEFCTTSAFYGYKHLHFTEGSDLHKAMRAIHKARGLRHFWIFEEDLALYQKSVRSMGEAIRDDKDVLFSWACFSTIKALSKWDWEELVSFGFNHVWIGIEAADSPFAKSQGVDMYELFDELRDMGVTTTGSAIFGLDHHSPDNVDHEIDNFTRCRPTTTQFGTLMPAYGTAVRQRYEERGWIKTTDYRDADLYSEIIDHPNFEDGQLLDTVFRAYDEYYDRTGPALYRMLETWDNGRRRFKDHRNEALRRRAEEFAWRVRGIRPIFEKTRKHLPNDEIRDRVDDRLGRIEADMGSMTAAEEDTAEMFAALMDAQVEIEKRWGRPKEQSVFRKLQFRDGVEVTGPNKGVELPQFQVQIPKGFTTQPVSLQRDAGELEIPDAPAYVEV